MPLENFLDKPLVVIMPDVSVDLAHDLAELVFGDSVLVIQVGFKSPQNVFLEVRSNQRWFLERVEDCGDEISNDVDVDGVTLPVLEGQDSEDLRLSERIKAGGSSRFYLNETPMGTKGRLAIPGS